jgi:branched-chain amino acid transport system ATP-binding protein
MSLELRDIHTFYGDSHILRGVSLRVGEGELVSVLGRNGAGKTTTIRSIIGFTPPKKGEIVFKGVKLTGKPAHEIARLGIGLVYQGRRIFPNLTVRENLLVATRRGQWDLDKIFALFPRLAERLKNRGDQLSGGEQQMLAIGRALMTNPTLLIMDEPSEGLAPLMVTEVEKCLVGLKQSGLSVLLVEQNFMLATRSADRAYIISKGQTVYDGLPDELARNEQIKHMHLGLGM